MSVSNTSLLVAIGFVAGACGGSSDNSKNQPPTSGPDEEKPAGDSREPVAKPQIEPTGASDKLVPIWADLGGRFDAQTDEFAEAGLRALLPILPELHADCEAGSALACHLFEENYTWCLNAARGAPTAAPAVHEQCEKHNQLACALEGQAKDRPSGLGGDTVAAIDALQKVCDAGYRGACVQAAMLRSVLATETDADADQAVLQTACDKGYPAACSWLHYKTGAYLPGDYDLSNHYEPHVRACATGSVSACVDLLERLTPPPPFGCDRCDHPAYQFDDRCTQCFIVQCQRENCPGRHACCGEEPTATLPEKGPVLPAATAARVLAAAKRGVAMGRALLEAGCTRGHERMCQAKKIDEALAELENKLRELQQPR